MKCNARINFSAKNYTEVIFSTPPLFYNFLLNSLHFPLLTFVLQSVHLPIDSAFFNKLGVCTALRNFSFVQDNNLICIFNSAKAMSDYNDSFIFYQSADSFLN